MYQITPNQIVRMNEIVTGIPVDTARKQKVKSAFSSVDYYDAVQYQISCVVCSIVKNHYFIDGNKRTALFVYIVLCSINNIDIKHNSIELANTMQELAVHPYDVEYGVSLLFKE